MSKTPTGTATSRRTLDRSLMTGVAWSGAARAVAQAFSWSVFVVVARVLTPADFGVSAAASTAVGLIGLLTEFGLGVAIVSKSDLTSRDISQLAGVGVIGAIIAWVAATALAIPMASALRLPELRLVLPVLGISIGLGAMIAVPTSLLRKQLRFKTLSVLEMLRAFAAAAALLTLALSGAGYWSFVLSEVLAGLVMLGLLAYNAPVRIMKPVWSEIASSLKFSRDVLVSRFAWYAYTNADFAIVSRVLGKAALGAYSMAWTLVTLPNEKIATLIFSVTPSIFARVQFDDAEFRRYVLLLLEGLSALLFPICAGLALVAPEFVPIVLGDKWTSSIPIVQSLAAFAVFRAVSPLGAQVLVSRGRTRAAMWYSIAGLAVLPTAFWFGARWGTIGVGLVWTVVYPPLVALQLRAAGNEIGLPLRTMLASLAPSLIGTVLMTLTVWFLREYLVGANVPPVWRLIACSVAGAAVYAGWLALTARERMKQAYRVIRNR